jgi:TRAP-type mannitol/chloroaromatic compound transport system substrate-binding protein
MSLTRRAALTAGIAAAATGPLAAPAIAQSRVTWRIQTLWQAGTVNQLAFERFCENVRAMSDGRMNITPLPSGAAVGLLETLDAVSQGLLDGHHPATVYWTGRNPAFGVLGDLNGGYESPYQAQEWYEVHGGIDLIREAYADFDQYVIGVAWWGIESIPVSRAVRGPQELDGLKMRLPQGMAADIFSRFGVAAVSLPGSEVYGALDRGVIDAADWGTLGMNAQLGLHERARFAIHPGIHSMPVGDVTVARGKWEALPDDLKAILTVGVREFSRDMVQSVAAQDARVEVELHEAGVELLDWSPEARREFRSAAREVWEEYAGRNDLSRRAVDGQVAFLRSKGLVD